MDQSPRLSGDEWQRWANQLLHRHYGAGHYQEVPDTDRGDAGIEGFSLTDGHVYQAYGPEGPLSVADEYAKLRIKLTEDIRKFIDNRQLLGRLFGSLRMTRWILFVPSFRSKDIVAHATMKAAEVVAAALPYVHDSDFKVVVLPEEAFSAERDDLLNHAITTIDVDTPPVAPDVIQAWADHNANDTLVDTLDTKLRKLPTLRNDGERAAFRNRMIQHFLDGQNAYEDLRQYPEVWAIVRKAKSTQERYVGTQAMSSSETPGQILQIAITTLKEKVRVAARALADGPIDAIAFEAVADWLMRCPLDFPEGSSNG